MHPAPSIIAFTVFSGIGFGLIAWLGLGATEAQGWVAFVFCALAFVLTTGGLMSSLFHLGQPTRFLKAFTQWRSSWLSREAVLAVAALTAFGLYALLWIFIGYRSFLLGALSAILSVLTVYCTSMIYAQMKSVPRWRSPLTPAIFVLASLAGGALLSGVAAAAIALLALLGAALVVDWMRGDGALRASATTLETATGLGRFGRARLLEPPHTTSNYLLKEMCYVVARNHVEKLRWIGLGLACILPIALLLALSLGHFVALVAVLSHIFGMVVLRWIFFAQAEHVVGFYYGVR